MHTGALQHTTTDENSHSHTDSAMATSAHLTIQNADHSARMRRPYDGYVSCAGLEVFEAAQRAAKSGGGEQALLHIKGVQDSRERSSWEPMFDGTKSGIEHFYVIRLGVYGKPHGVEIQHAAVPIGGELGNGHELTSYTLAEWRKQVVQSLHEANERLREVNETRKENGQAAYELHDPEAVPAAYVELTGEQRAVLDDLPPHDRTEARNAWLKGEEWETHDFAYESFDEAMKERIASANAS